MEFVILGLAALAVPVLGVWGFVRTVGLLRRADALEARLKVLEAQLGVAAPPLAAEGSAFRPGPAPAGEPAPPPFPSAPEQPEAAPGPDRPEQMPGEGLEPIAPWGSAAPADPGAPRPAIAVEGGGGPPASAAIPPAAAPGRSLEEAIGTRWAVWLGGLALALGGLFLVRYSIEQGWFGPAARTLFGALFAVALIAAGEVMRRRERDGRAPSLAAIPSAHVPSILTAAGTVAAFGTVYAAHALYGFVGPIVGFALLGAVAFATMALAAVHGPMLAGLGLAAAFVVPLLVTSSDPQPWPVVLYLATTTGGAYGLARIRHWAWLAYAAAIGAGLWGIIFAIELPSTQVLAAMAHTVFQTGLAIIMLVAGPYRGTDDAEAVPDRVALPILAGFAGIAGMILLGAGVDGLARPLFAAVMAAMLLAAAFRHAPVAGAAVLAAAVLLIGAAAWPVAREAMAEGVRVLPGGAGVPPMPDAVWSFLLFAVLSAAAITVAAWARLLRSPSLPLSGAIAWAVAGALAPLAMLVLAWWRLRGFDESLPFGLAASGLAIAFLLATGTLRGARDTGGTAAALGFEAFAAATLAALAIGLVMVLDRGALTVALALSALGAAVVTSREPVGSLRLAVGALGLVVLGRLAYDPTVMGGDVGRLPILNWLLWGYGVPAVSFAGAAVLLGRSKRDGIVALCEGLALVFTGLLVALEIRHLVTGGIDTQDTSHLELGLQVTSGLLIATALVSLDRIRGSRVLRIGTYVFGFLSLGGALLGLLLVENPLVHSGETIVGGAIFNSLLAGYLAPALAAALLAWRAQGRRPRWFVALAALLGFLLSFAWLVLQIRFLWKGPAVAVWRSTSDGELYTYSAAFLAVGLVLLAVGILRGSRMARLASAGYIVLTVAKVFLVDMSGLTGPLRALSFIGLGLVLVGIGLVYQKLVFARPAPPPPPPAAAPD